MSLSIFYFVLYFCLGSVVTLSLIPGLFAKEWQLTRLVNFLLLLVAFLCGVWPYARATHWSPDAWYLGLISGMIYHRAYFHPKEKP